VEWRRFGRCETCGCEDTIVFKPADFEVPPNGAWVCASCDPEEHEDYVKGLARFGDVLGHKPS
jgi:hypothetical protein